MKQFDKCPVCGSEKRWFSDIVQEEKDKGRMRPNFLLCFIQSPNAPVIDRKLADNFPIGSKVPTATAFADVCSDCGCVYAILLDRGEVVKQAVQAKPGQPIDLANFLNVPPPGTEGKN